MTCNGCVAKVKNQLLKHPKITAAEVQLEVSQARITMQKHLTVADMQDAIGNDNKYRISEVQSISVPSNAAEQGSWVLTNHFY